MIYSAFPPSHEEYVEYDELRQLEDENRTLIEEHLKVQFEDDLTRFRCDVLTKLYRHDALQGSDGWVTFREDYELASGATITDNRLFKTVAILSAATDRPVSPGSNTCMPQIRILTNELVLCGEDCLWITQDIAIDEDGDTQYLLEVFDSEKELIEETRSVIFVADGSGVLGVTKNFQPFTPIVKLYPDNEPIVKNTDIVPLGVYTCLRDKIDALAFARQILNDVESVEPSDCQRNVSRYVISLHRQWSNV